MKYGTHTITKQFADDECIGTRERFEERVRVKDQKQELIAFMKFRAEHSEDDDVCFKVEHTPNGDDNGFYYVLMSYSRKVL